MLRHEPGKAVERSVSMFRLAPVSPSRTIAPLMNDDLPADAPNSPPEPPFRIMAKADQVLHRVAVSHAHHVLLNNWTGIECLRSHSDSRLR